LRSGYELRDGDKERYGGSAQEAVAAVIRHDRTGGTRGFTTPPDQRLIDPEP
jgi:hypothetical protein